MAELSPDIKGLEKPESYPNHPQDDFETAPMDAIPKSRWQRVWPTIAAGAGLFSDGYLNGVIGSVNTMLKQIYTTEYTESSAQSNVASIAFAGTVVGQLFFGYLSDHWSRKQALLLSTIILILFAALGAGSCGAGGSIQGLFAALAAYRFLLGIGIGGEYPAGSVACAENTGELKKGHRNRWFIFFTNFMIDAGFVVAALVPMIVVLATTEKHLRAAWRICLGLGVIPPLSLLYLRIKLKEPEEYNRQKMTKYPYWLIVKFYWFRLLVVSLIWFMYDFSAYSFSIYSSSWLTIILGDSAPLWKSFGWNTVINLFYIPGAFAGAFLSDWIGPKYCLSIGVLLQGIVGFIMAALYGRLDTPSHVAGFVVVYGIFLALGEAGPGDNIGLMASKTSATSIRGQYYGIAAAAGKIGAFVGSYLFPIIIADAGDDKVKQGQYPFYVSSSLCILSAVLAVTCLPNVGQDTIVDEDVRFRAYLEAQGYDVSSLGTKEYKQAKAKEMIPSS
ncbi:MFS general substrate transporter [Aulographum hederae CBS 113979]|uniref:MFS general substrate transporter n=1 Tax=Aulographum hederae CBS 113979 TaxID=1176131 RepID=A0A6G1H5C0_9PEZI|nr:MFS general substrate transporter [Aulographum hederae CBS 113979]